MVRDDVEIEVAGKHDHDTGNNIEALDSKAPDGEILQCEVTGAGDGNKCEDGGRCLNEVNEEAEDKIPLNNEMEDQTNPQTETNEPMTSDGSTGEQMNIKTNIEDQTVNEQTDAKNEVVEKNASNGGVKVEKPAENGVEIGYSVKNVIEEKNAENGVEGENLVKNVIEEKNDENGVEGENLVKNVVDEKIAEKHKDSERINQDADTESDSKNTQVLTDVPSNEAPPSQNAASDKVLPGGDEEMEDAANNNVNEAKEVNDEVKEQGKDLLVASPVTGPNAQTIETLTKHEGDHSSLPSKHEAGTPSARYLPVKAGEHSGETVKTVFTPAALPLMAEGDDGTPEDQAAFMKEIESFYRERAMDFKPPKFYGQPLNCLKLWRAVIRLGGYDRVTGSKLWRQVGESFHPPKTCTTVSWTFRIFYEKSLLEYERHKTQSGELQLPVAAFHEASAADTEGNGYQGSGSIRARRESAARAMQGWLGQRLFANGEVGEPVIKDKSISNMAKRDKNVKTIGSLKQKRPNEAEHSVKAARIETSKQLATTVVDVGPPADWVKVNVRQTKDCFEVYALVPGLLREEVRVQSDPAGRLVITGQPEQVDNPWGITPFKKVVSLPSRIDPLQTSAVVSLHGRLFVRVPFEQSNG
ncbi:AT-rich interactive domain-containing protein 5 [Phtheirospermum japonicum]|uniref:AT-rich interactive domain-containing protein 5 n=1 Tax=Phtheirospermum japonicum TaxID=374723 RepID=A0A830CHS7_9LAMI|nr:AT-rich interactive domain-containing protein 5 [Phtheirospermum japonicum]